MICMTKAVLVWFALPCSSMAVAAACSIEQKAVNQVNASILVDQTPSFIVPKSINMRIESKDGFMQGKGNFSFDRCGGLLHAEVVQERNEKAPKGILSSIFTMNVGRREYGWDTAMTFRNSFTETLKQKNTMFVDAQTKGLYLVNPKGAIEKSSDITEGIYGTLRQTSTAMTHYQYNSEGQIVSAKRTSSLKSDRTFTQFNYNAAGQLTGKQSASRKSKYSYDKSGRLAEEISVQIFSTTEKAVTQCIERDKFEQCIKAVEHVTIIIPGNAEGKDKIEEHDVNVNRSYIYWE
jgi:YD repeat-containing protein